MASSSSPRRRWILPRSRYRPTSPQQSSAATGQPAQFQTEGRPKARGRRRDGARTMNSLGRSPGVGPPSVCTRLPVALSKMLTRHPMFGDHDSRLSQSWYLRRQQHENFSPAKRGHSRGQGVPERTRQTPSAVPAPPRTRVPPKFHAPRTDPRADAPPASCPAARRPSCTPRRESSLDPRRVLSRR